MLDNLPIFWEIALPGIKVCANALWKENSVTPTDLEISLVVDTVEFPRLSRSQNALDIDNKRSGGVQNALNP